MNRRFLCASALSLFVPAFAWAQPEEKHGAPGGGHPHGGGGHGPPGGGPPPHEHAPMAGGHMEHPAPSHAPAAHEHAPVHEHAAVVHERTPVHERAPLHEHAPIHERQIGRRERAISHERAVSARHSPSRRFVERGREHGAGPVGPYRIGQGRPAGFHPIRVRPFRYPRGWRYRRWGVGAVLPALFLTPAFFFDDYWRLGLGGPPYGYVWVRFGPDLLLVDRFTGRIVDVIYGAFLY